MRPLIGYQVCTRPFDENTVLGQMYDYWFTGNGAWIYAKRDDLFQVLFQVSNFDISGLPAIAAPDFTLTPPRLPVGLMMELIRRSHREAVRELEILFHLDFYQDQWWLETPKQLQTAVMCEPTDTGLGSSHQTALIEIHSHHSMLARFSATDNKDETGLRIYGVIGRVLDRPEIRFRVGVYGHFWEIPADWVCEMPEGLRDCVTGS